MTGYTFEIKLYKEQGILSFKVLALLVTQTSEIMLVIYVLCNIIIIIEQPTTSTILFANICIYKILQTKFHFEGRYYDI